MRLVLASGNPDKLKELRQLLDDLDLEIVPAGDLIPGWSPAPVAEQPVNLVFIELEGQVTQDHRALGHRAAPLWCG